MAIVAHNNITILLPNCASLTSIDGSISLVFHSAIIPVRPTAPASLGYDPLQAIILSYSLHRMKMDFGQNK